MRPEHLKAITDLRHELHRHPELSLHEHGTKKRLIEFITARTSLEITDCGSWFYAVKYGTDPAAGNIAFRADMDALPIDESLMSPENAPDHTSENPGVSHKCGHDGHCAALCGLALELEGRVTARTIYLIFQHAEETGIGGRICSALIDEKKISEIYAFHNLGGYPEGAVVYRKGLTQPSSEGLEILFHGVTSHAGMPEDGRNPAEVMSETVLKSTDLAQRPSKGMVLCTVAGMNAGTGDFGISAGEGTLRLTLRAEYEEELAALRNEILEFAKKTAASRGISTEFNIYDSFPETRNTGHGIGRVLAAADALSCKTIEMDDLWRASEDFGHYLKKCEGAMFYIGTGSDRPALHTLEYDFNDRILETAADMFTELACRQ